MISSELFIPNDNIIKYVYIIKVIPTNELYAGQHTCKTKEDIYEYYGSGVNIRAREYEYGRCNLQIIHVKFCETYEELDRIEQYTIVKLAEKKQSSCLNIIYNDYAIRSFTKEYKKSKECIEHIEYKKNKINSKITSKSIRHKYIPRIIKNNILKKYLSIYKTRVINLNSIFQLSSNKKYISYSYVYEIFKQKYPELQDDLNFHFEIIAHYFNLQITYELDDDNKFQNIIRGLTLVDKNINNFKKHKMEDFIKECILKFRK